MEVDYPYIVKILSMIYYFGGSGKYMKTIQFENDYFFKSWYALLTYDMYKTYYITIW